MTRSVTALAATLALALGAASTLSAKTLLGGQCPDWSCTSNGRAETGIAIAGLDRIPPGGSQRVVNTKPTSPATGCGVFLWGNNGASVRGIAGPGFELQDINSKVTEVRLIPRLSGSSPCSGEVR